jgi:hypothetical protein
MTQTEMAELREKSKQGLAVFLTRPVVPNKR